MVTTLDHISIRRAAQLDWQVICQLQSAGNRPARKDSRPEEYFLAESNSELIGCAAVRICSGYGYIYGLVVHKSWRRRGIGHALTEARLAYLRSAGIHAVFVLAMFWNVRFFKRHGFEITKRAMFPELLKVHNDFSEDWSRRSALLKLEFGEKGSC